VIPGKEAEVLVSPDQTPVLPDPEAGEPASEHETGEPAGEPAGEHGTSEPAGDSQASADLPAQQWERILLAIKSQKIVLHAYLLASVRQERKEGKLILYFDPLKGDFHKNRSEEKENLEMIKEVASEILGCDINVECGFLGGRQEEDPVDKAIRLFGRNVVKLE
ncbi:MAG: hypothetical protein FWH28_08085, partial [Clostridiales bacterium]|nr:hypothetical protein [Clostridiales bacterium]